MSQLSREQIFEAFRDEAQALVHQKILSRDDASAIASAFARIAFDLLIPTAKQGWVAVPKEPTEEMLWALCEHSDSPREACLHCPAKETTRYGEGTRACRSLVEDQYRAMLAAAPNQPAPLREGPAVECSHDLTEREVAVADGMCPLCLAAELDKREEELQCQLDDYWTKLQAAEQRVRELEGK